MELGGVLAALREDARDAASRCAEAAERTAGLEAWASDREETLAAVRAELQEKESRSFSVSRWKW